VGQPIMLFSLSPEPPEQRPSFAVRIFLDKQDSDGQNATFDG
jgi:hypothetical protein